jgi:hypothetical protein
MLSPSYLDLPLLSPSCPTSTVALMSICSHLRILPPLLLSCLPALTFVSYLYYCPHALSLLSFRLLPPLLPSCPVFVVIIVSYLHCRPHALHLLVIFVSYLHCCPHVLPLLVLPPLLPSRPSSALTSHSFVALVTYHFSYLRINPSLAPSCPLLSLCSTLVSSLQPLFHPCVHFPASVPPSCPR